MPEPVTPVKCLVWDLDNTLWQGTLVEDGEVRLTDEVRAVIAALDARGILQAICSRNDHDHAWAQLEQLDVADYFVLSKIGWGRKSDAVREIAAELKFADRTIAFVDDQPAERAEVAFHLPEVRCYPAERIASFVDLPEFSPATVTEDARRRRVMYQAGVRRAAEQASFPGSHDDFLRTLGLDLRIARATREGLARVEELTLRTSQMNATGVHYSDTTLRELLADPGYEVLTATLTDRFGPHGAIGVILLAVGTDAPAWHLKLLATSCRVVAFGIGTVILNWLVDQAAAAGTHLVADFRATERNRMMDIAYRFAGFTDDGCGCVDALGASEDGVRRLHLVPEHRTMPDTLRLTAPDLNASCAPG